MWICSVHRTPMDQASVKASKATTDIKEKHTLGECVDVEEGGGRGRVKMKKKNEAQ